MDKSTMTRAERLRAEALAEFIATASPEIKETLSMPLPELKQDRKTVPKVDRKNLVLPDVRLKCDEEREAEKRMERILKQVRAEK